MALDETLILRIQADDAELTVGDLKQGIKDLNKEILNVEKGSSRYNELVQTLGKARGEFMDIKEEANAFNPERRAAAFAQVGASLAGGFQLATGAMALLGTESQDVEKALLKVQAATALAQGVQSVGDLGKAFNVLKLIIMANPIMTIATVIAAAAVAIYGFAQNTEDAEAKQKKLNEELEKTVSLMKGLGREALTTDEVVGRIVSGQKASAITTAELAAAMSDLKKKQSEVTSENQVYIATTEDKITNEKEFAEFAAKAAADERADIQKTIDLIQAEVDKRDEDGKLAAKRNDDKKKILADFLDFERQSLESEVSDEKAVRATVTESIKYEAEQQAQIKESQKQRESDAEKRLTTDTLSEIEKRKQAEAEAAAQKKAVETELFNFASSVGNALINLQNIKLQNDLKAAGTNEKLKEKLIIDAAKKHKKLQIAMATIDMARAISAANTLVPPANIIAMIAAAATGALQIAAIAKTPLPDAGGGDSGVIPTAPPLPPFNPSGNSQPQQQQFQGQGTGTIQNDNQFQGFQGEGGQIKAYVVESEITESQTKIKKIKDSATFP